jgi:hypothetical protein
VPFNATAVDRSHRHGLPSVAPCLEPPSRPLSNHNHNCLCQQHAGACPQPSTHSRTCRHRAAAEEESAVEVHAAIHSHAAPLDEVAVMVRPPKRIQSARPSKSTRVEAHEVRTAEELPEGMPPPPQHHAAVRLLAQTHAAEGIIRKPHLLSHNAPRLRAVGRRFLPTCDSPMPTPHGPMIATAASCAARGLF